MLLKQKQMLVLILFLVQMNQFHQLLIQMKYLIKIQNLVILIQKVKMNKFKGFSMMKTKSKE
jgi:hypothetical protein